MKGIINYILRDKTPFENDLRNKIIRNKLLNKFQKLTEENAFFFFSVI